MVKWLTILIAVIGFAIGLWTVATANREEPEPPPVAQPSINPFDSGIAATGVVEAASRNIEVAPSEPGLVVSVAVEVNDRVATGDLLFALDTRPLESELLVAAAQVKVAEADEAFQRLELDRLREVHQRGAATAQELARQEALYRSAAATTEQSRAQVASLQTQIDRLRVRSPIAGTVLRRNIEPGEYASPGVADPAMVVGDLSHLHVRAQVNEEDAPRVRPGAAAVARVRGPIDARAALEMIRIEPLATRQQQFTGDRGERIDTRVVEVVLRVTSLPDVPIYPGQIVDVFIEGVESPRPASAAGPTD